MSSSAAPQDLSPERGQRADSPMDIPSRGWWDIAKRVFRQLGEDNISLLAAGVAFYAFLAMFPAMIATVSLYVLIAEPADIQRNLDAVAGLLPAQAYEIIRDRLSSLSAQDSEGLGLGAMAGILLAIWSANKGTKALFDGVNVAYDERDDRGFFRKNARTLLFTVGAAAGGIIALALIAGFSAVVAALSLPQSIVLIMELVRWSLLGILIVLALGLIYRFAAARSHAQIRWLGPGSAIAALLWLLVSFGFSFYVSRFGSYDETYGSLAGVVVLLLWMSISAYVVLLGAEINSEAEHQTVVDTTTGRSEPLGRRGAFHADHVAQVPE